MKNTLSTIIFSFENGLLHEGLMLELVELLLPGADLLEPFHSYFGHLKFSEIGSFCSALKRNSKLSIDAENQTA